MAAGIILIAVGFSLVLSANLNDVNIIRGIDPWSDVKPELNAMRSRRVLTHDANLILLKWPHLAPKLANHKKKTGSMSLFLVRFETRNRTERNSELQRVSAYVRYFSKDKLVAALSADDLSMFSATEIFELPSALKMQPELYSAARHRGLSDVHKRTQRLRSRAEERKCAAVQLNVALISTTTEASSIDHEIESLCSESSSVHVNMSLCRLLPVSGSQRKRVIETDECVQHLAAERLAGHPAVTWVEVRAKMRLRNKYATRIVQSKNGSSWTLWEKGLTGEGEVVLKNFDAEISLTHLPSLDNFCFNCLNCFVVSVEVLQVIGVTDTGLDYNSCFFRDESIALPTCMGEGHVQTPGCVNYQHRKIVTYVSFL
jgi:hypothetical protein